MIAERGQCSSCIMYVYCASCISAGGPRCMSLLVLRCASGCTTAAITAYQWLAAGQCLCWRPRVSAPCETCGGAESVYRNAVREPDQVKNDVLTANMLPVSRHCKCSHSLYCFYCLLARSTCHIRSICSPSHTVKCNHALMLPRSPTMQHPIHMYKTAATISRP